MKTVSVIIPVYNHADRIGRCLESVLSQTYRQLEIIIVDDGSTDNLVQMVKPVWNQIKLIHQENMGQGAARNAGVRVARGDWVAFLDSDDLWDPRKLEVQMNYLEQTDYEWVHNRTRILPELEVPQYFGDWFQGERSGKVAKQLLSTNFICTSSVVIRKSILVDVGGFSEDRELQNFEDYELWLRIAALVPIGYVDEPLTFYTTDSLDSAQQESRLTKIKKNELVMRRLEKMPFDTYTKSGIFRRRIQYKQDHFQQALLAGYKEQARIIMEGLNRDEKRVWKRFFNTMLLHSPQWLITLQSRIYYMFFKRKGT